MVKADLAYCYQVERVGETFSIDALVIEDDNNLPDIFQKLIDTAIERKYPEKMAFILISSNYQYLSEAAQKILPYQKPVLYLKGACVESMKKLYSENNCPVCLSGEDLQMLSCQAEQLEQADIKDIILDIPTSGKANIIETLTLIRRSIIRDNFKPLRFPVITFASDYTHKKDSLEEGLWAGNLICKYTNVVVLDHFDPAIILALLTLRLNLYTDPQKPLQIEPKLYEIGEVDEYSPVLVTTNFALTYFTVAGEIEASGIPCYLLITPSEGMSVLTAWAANKFNGEIIAKAVREYSLNNKVKNKKLLITGYVDILKEEIEEELPEWEVLIAPKEAVEIPDYLQKLDREIVKA
jgi:acetyl-CoA decarbonylase/synthase, CODH/ACS complex subunit gamma